LIDAAAQVPGVRVVTAGRLVEPWLEEKIHFASHVEYLGVLPQEDILRRTCDADVVFAFYNPLLEINRRASSAKWYDAMMAGRPVLSNSEIINAPWIESEGFGFICDFSIDRLIAILRWLRDNPEERQVRGARARSLFEARFNRRHMNELVGQAVLRATGSGNLLAEVIHQ